MPNQTLTPTAITRKETGWWDVTADGKSWGIPPEDRETKVSNEPIAKEIEASLGKPIDLSVWEKPDGTTRMIFGKAKAAGKGGGGGGTAWRNTADGQRFEQQNMNRRTALMCAKEIGERYDVTGNAVLELAGLFWDWLQAPFSEGSAGPSSSKGKAGEAVPPSITPTGGNPATGGGVDLLDATSPAGDGDENYPLERLKSLIAQAGYSPDDLPELIGVRDPEELGPIQMQKYADLIEKKLRKKGAA